MIVRATATVVLGTSNFGHDEPRIELQFEGDPSYRHVYSYLYILAAACELASEEESPWVVVVDQERTNVHLELAYEAHDREAVAQEGMSMLRSVLREQIELRDSSG